MPLVLAVCFLQCITPARSFFQAPVVASSRRQQYRIKATSDDSPVTTAMVAAEDKDFLQDAEILELTMLEHRPLGCTVEESLGKLYGKVVFCTKVTPGGFAEQAGVQPGDVFVGVSGMFGDLEDVTEAGIDRV